jgi:hypothetical protein
LESDQPKRASRAWSALKDHTFAVSGNPLRALGALLIAVVVFGIWLVKALESQEAARRQPISQPSFYGVHAREVRAEVVKLEWHHEVKVDRWQVESGQGFEESKPADAFEVRAAGKRHHHYDTVQSGTHTEHVSKTVSDGYETERERVQEACGEDCTSGPEHCEERCTSNHNGFATCRTVCTPGQRTCVTRYCTKTKERSVPKTKTVTVPVVVPTNVDVSRTATWYTWKVWTWKYDRSLTATGDSAETHWPSAEAIALGRGLKAPMKERAQREASYRVECWVAGSTFVVTPDTAEAFSKFQMGSKHRLRVWPDRVEVLSSEPVSPTPIPSETARRVSEEVAPSAAPHR